MKLILTGASGFIGSAYLRHLNDAGIDDVIAVDVQPTGDHPNLRGKKLSAYVTREDLIDRLDRGQFREVDAVVHLGACSDTSKGSVSSASFEAMARSRRRW